METASLVVLATSRTWLTCHGSQSEGLVHWFFQVCGNSFTTVMPRLWAVIEMQCNESTICIYPWFKRQYFLQTIENSNLLTYFTTEFTNLSLKLKLVIDSDASEFHFILNRDNGSFTGQHSISLDSSKSNCLIFFMIYFHLVEFKPLINLFRSALMASWFFFSQTWTIECHRHTWILCIHS